MAKILVEDQEEQTRVPFLRGILIRSLQDAGMPFEDSFRIATEVRADLDDTPLISTSDLHSMVLERLKATNRESIISR